MYQMAQQVQLTVLPPMYFELVITGGGSKIIPVILFSE